MLVYSDRQLEGFSDIIFITHKRTESSDVCVITNNRNHDTYNKMNFYIIILVWLF
jgi:hypothetical protein